MTIRGFRLYHGIELSSKLFYSMLKDYNNFEMPIGERRSIILEDSKESKKFLKFILANSKSK